MWMEIATCWPYRHCRSTVASAAIALAVSAAPAALSAQETAMPTQMTGKAILDHPAGKATLEAAKLLRAGKLAEVRKNSAREVRDEWAGMPADEQREETERLRERAPEPKTLAEDIARNGVLTFYGETAQLYATSADGNLATMAFIQLEEGKWRVTGGPVTNDISPVVETAPAVVGEDILGHEIGRMALAYAQQVEMGDLDGAMEFATSAAQAKRKALSPEERHESDKFAKSFWPSQAALAEQIAQGGRVTFEGESAYLVVNTNVQTTDADGTIHSTSTSYTIPFGLDEDVWRVAN